MTLCAVPADLFHSSSPLALLYPFPRNLILKPSHTPLTSLNLFVSNLSLFSLAPLAPYTLLLLATFAPLHRSRIACSLSKISALSALFFVSHATPCSRQYLFSLASFFTLTSLTSPAVTHSPRPFLTITPLMQMSRSK